MGPAQLKALLEEYQQFLVDEDDLGIERVLNEAPDNPEFFSALAEIHRWYEEEFGLTPSPEDQLEGLEQLQRILGTLHDHNSTTRTDACDESITPPPPEGVEVDGIVFEGSHAGDGSSDPLPPTGPSPVLGVRKARPRATSKRPQSSNSPKKPQSPQTHGDNPRPIKRANAFQKATLAARIVSDLHEEPTFGDVKFQKVIYMVEHHAQLPSLQSTYRRYAYGPHDTRLFNGVKGMMEKQRWFKAVERKGRTFFVPLDDPDGYLPTYQKIWGDKDDKIREVIERFRRLRTRQAEIVATMYAVWNDFIIEGRSFDDADLIYEALHNWDPKKQTIKEQEWARGLDWLRKTGLVPTGFGKLSRPASR